MKKLITVALFSIICASSAQAERILGIAEIPAIFGKEAQGFPIRDMEMVRTNPEGSIILHTSPGSEPISSSGGDINYDAFFPEKAGAVVYDIKDKWYKIKVLDHFYWIESHNVSKFHTYDSLVRTNSPFLKNWDNVLYSEPGYDKPAQNIKPGYVNAQIIGSTVINGEIWYKIDIYDGRLAEGGEVVATGWLPLYNKAGDNNFGYTTDSC